MILPFLIAFIASAPPSARVRYEQKCLYCHSEEVTEAKKFSDSQWRRIVERMRLKAPLLISRSEVPALSRYMTQTLKLGAEVSGPKPDIKPIDVQPIDSLALAKRLEGSPTPVLPQPDAAEQTEVNDGQAALEAQAMGIIEQRCSKCHSLGRVYGRLDSFERSMSTLERMRLKTGSGITDDELRILQDYLRAQF